MSERELQILETFKNIIPSLSELEQEKLLSFGEGMAFMKDRSNKEGFNIPSRQLVTKQTYI